jgi:ubiquinone/menaquinone biosynthesis C-methylase UbiE
MSTKASTRRWFDHRAGSYDGGFTSRWRDPVQRGSLDALGLTAEDRLLDVGCGTGTASRAAADLAASVVGIDLSPEMIRRAEGLAEGIENVRFEVADAEELPFGDREFTAVLCSNSFHHYPDPLQAVREMARVLAPNGRLVIGDACADLATARVADRLLRWFEPGHVRLYRSTELGSFLHRAGFSQVMLRRLSGGGLAIVRGTVVDRE